MFFVDSTFTNQPIYPSSSFKWPDHIRKEVPKSATFGNNNNNNYNNNYNNNNYNNDESNNYNNNNYNNSNNNDNNNNFQTFRQDIVNSQVIVKKSPEIKDF